MVSCLVLIGAILVATLAGFFGGLLWTARPFRSARSNYDSHSSVSAVIERVNAENEGEDRGDCRRPSDDREWQEADPENDPELCPVTGRTERIIPVDVQLYGGADDSNPACFATMSLFSPLRVRQTRNVLPNSPWSGRWPPTPGPATGYHLCASSPLAGRDSSKYLAW